MKRYFTPLLLLLGTLTVNAQDAQKSDTPKIQWLQLQVGGGINNGYNMQDQLNTPSIDVTYNNYVKYSNVKGFYSFGIGGMKLITDRILIGAAVNYGKILTQKDGIAQFQTTIYNGMLNIGELLYNKDGLMLYPYGGVGYSFYSMDIKNISTTGNVAFDLNNPITPGNKQTYTTDYIVFELGVGVKKVINSNLAVGIDAGFYLSPTYGGDWKSSGTTIDSRQAPGTNGGFLRATIGYGLFQ